MLTLIFYLDNVTVNMSTLVQFHKRIISKVYFCQPSSIYNALIAKLLQSYFLYFCSVDVCSDVRSAGTGTVYMSDMAAVSTHH